MSARVKETMTTTALERVRGLADGLVITEDYEAVSHFVRTRFAGDGGWLIADCAACAHDNGPIVADFIAAACNYVRSDEFDALVRDAMAWRAVTGGEILDQAIDAERGGG